MCVCARARACVCVCVRACVRVCVFVCEGGGEVEAIYCMLIFDLLLCTVYDRYVVFVNM